ncbi:MAG: sugar transferase [Candidatus Saccharibacteria bacterium]|nr:sugar transferase [Candidatus Saccharibacteria bacterium]
MRNNASVFYSLILVIGDALALTAAFSVAYTIRVKVQDELPLIEQITALEFLYTFLAVLPFWLLVHAAIGLYRKDIYEKRFVELGRLITGAFIGILVVIGYDFVIGGELFPARLVPVYGFGLSFGLLLLFRTATRILRRLLFRFKVGISDVLIIGNTDASIDLARIISDTKTSGIRVMGIVGKKSPRFKYFASFEDAIKKLPSHPHGIIHTELYKDDLKNNEIVRFAQENHVSYRFMPGNSNLFVGNIEVDLFAGLPMIAVHQTKLIGWGRIAKRLFDLFFTSLALIVLSPVIAVIAVVLKISDPRGPVFFRQVRLTRFNREFKVFKFRTHRADISGLSDKAAFKKLGKPKLYETYKNNGYVLAKDPRISKVGRFLRRTSLDELPQLFNVILGDLSLVGPRTLIPAELNTYKRKHAILSVKAGITGLAQISGREDISFEERRRLDVYYVQNWSFVLDISILLRTIRVVLLGTGAK